MKIYNKILTKFLLPISDLVFSEKMFSEYQKLNKLLKLDENQLQEIQNKKLSEILKNSYQHVPFYKNLNINFSNNPYKDIKKYPIIDKTILRNQEDKLISNNYKKSKLIKHVSSGSSGEQSVVYWTSIQQSQNRSVQVTWWHWAGYNFGMPILQTGITPKRGFIKKVKDFFLRTNYVNAFSHSDEDISNNLLWAKGKQAFLAGYASSLYVFSEFSKKNKKNINFSGAVAWGDKLFLHYKKSINKEFNVEVKETYASAEGLMIAAQLDLEYMYIMSTSVFIEILDDNGNEVEDGKMGNVVVTCLNAFAMPLIRYKIGDLAIKLPKNEYPESKKLAFPLLKKVIGRDTDIIHTISGRKMVVHSFTGIFEHYPEILQFCVIQNQLTSITIKIIINEDFNQKILKKISSEINNYVNGELDINFDFVDVIHPTPSGKPQIIISNLKK